MREHRLFPGTPRRDQSVAGSDGQAVQARQICSPPPPPQIARPSRAGGLPELLPAVAVELERNAKMLVSTEAIIRGKRNLGLIESCAAPRCQVLGGVCVWGEAPDILPQVPGF